MVKYLILIITFLLVLEANLFSSEQDACALAAIEKANHKLEQANFKNISVSTVEWNKENTMLTINGRINDIPTAKDIRLGSLGVTRNLDGTVSLSIGVSEEARGQGLQNIMYAKMIEKYPDITGVRHYLAESNQEAYYKALISEMKNKKWANSKQIKGMVFDSFEQEFNSCCLSRFLSRSQVEQKQLAEAALKETPAHKSSSSIGFSKICKMQFTGEDPVPEFVSCR